MLISRLEVSYYRQFEKEEIYFPFNGLIGFRGVNGAGKSTLFNVIDWVLWGKYKGVNQKNLLKMHKTPKNVPTYGITDFVFNGDYYRVRRDLVNSKTKNYVEKNKHRVATGTTQVNSYIQNLFNMDQETFRICYYASQFDFDALTQMKDAPRAAMISKLLRIETIDETAKQARDDRKKCEIEIAEAKRHLKDETLLDNDLEQYKQQELELQKELKAHDKEVEALEKKRNAISSDKEKSNKVYEAYQNLAVQMSNLETKKSTLLENSLKTEEDNLQLLEEKQQRLTQIAHQKDNYFSLLQSKDNLNEAKENFLAVHRLEQQISEIQNNLQHYQGVIKTATEKLQSFITIEDSLVTTEQEIARIEDVLSTARDHGQELQTRLNINKSSYQEVVKDKQTLENLGEEVPCPTCKRPLGDHLGNQLDHLESRRMEIIQETAKMKLLYDELVEKGLSNKKNLDELKEKQNALHMQLREKSGIVNQIDNATQELERQVKTLENLEQQRSQYPAVIEFDPNNYKSLLEEIQSLTPVYEEIIQLQNQVQDIPKAQQRIDDIKSQVTQISADIDKLLKEQEELNFNKEYYASLAQQMDEAQKSLDNVKENRYNTKSKLDKLAVSMESIKSEMKQHEEMKEQLKDKQQEILDLAKLDELFKAYKQDTLAELAPKIADKMSDMIDVATDGLYTLVELDEHYNIFIYRDGEKHPLEIFSGGEQKLAALLQRIAVSQLLVEQTSQASFDMIALDEVTSAFDESRQDSMIDMLRSLNGVFQQILIVSHNEHVKDSFDHTLIIERGPNKKSTARWALTESGKTSFDLEEVKAFVKENFEAEEPVDDGMIDEVSEELTEA